MAQLPSWRGSVFYRLALSLRCAQAACMARLRGSSTPLATIATLSGLARYGLARLKGMETGLHRMWMGGDVVFFLHALAE